MAKIHFVGVPTVSHDQILRNREECRKRGYARISDSKKRDGRLAVVGGGPSVLSYLDEIRACNEVWGINGACQMLAKHGIESTMFAVDPDPIVVKWCPGVKRAILNDRICPEAFDALSGADIQVFELANDTPDGVTSGSSTASAAFTLGIKMGWAYIDFFGVDSSYEGATHAYQDEARKEELWVECGGRSYRTAPDFYLQAVEMSYIIRHFPNHYRAFGDGLLQAMIADPEHDITHVSGDLMAQLKPQKAA